VAVGYWNGWFSAMVYLRSTDWQPLQLYLRRMLILGVDAARLIDPDAARAMTEMRIGYAQVKYATIIFSSLPILLTFPFFQRYFVRGIVMGSLKE
jgi:putative aldouronate transport system permease protein